MKKNIFGSYLTLSLVAGLSFSQAFAQAPRAVNPNGEVTRAWAAYHIESRNYDKAISTLKEYIAKNPQDAEAYKMMGIAHRLQGDWEKADVALKKSASLSTEFDRGAALYLAADSELHAGNVTQAKATLEEVAKIPGLRGSAQAASKVAAVGGSLPPLKIDRRELGETGGRPWNLSLFASLGYDSNVLLLPDEETAGQNPATLLFTTGVQGGYSTILLGFDFTSNASVSYSRNFNSAAASFDNIPVSLGLEWGVPGSWATAHDLAITQSANATFVNTDGMGLFSTSAGAGAKGNILNVGGHVLELSFPFTYNWYPGVTAAPADDRTGIAISPSLSHRHTVFGLNANQSVSYGHQFAKGPNYVSSNYGANAGLGYQFPWEVNGNVSFGISKSMYPNKTPERSETKWTLGFDLSRTFKVGVPLNTSLSYAMENNSSTISAASYFKHSVVLKVDYAF